MRCGVSVNQTTTRWFAFGRLIWFCAAGSMYELHVRVCMFSVCLSGVVSVGGGAGREEEHRCPKLAVRAFFAAKSLLYDGFCVARGGVCCLQLYEAGFHEVSTIIVLEIFVPLQQLNPRVTAEQSVTVSVRGLGTTT